MYDGELSRINLHQTSFKYNFLCYTFIRKFIFIIKFKLTFLKKLSQPRSFQFNVCILCNFYINVVNVKKVVTGCKLVLWFKYVKYKYFNFLYLLFKVVLKS